MEQLRHLHKPLLVRVHYWLHILAEKDGYAIVHHLLEMALERENLLLECWSLGKQRFRHLLAVDDFENVLVHIFVVALPQIHQIPSTLQGNRSKEKLHKIAEEDRVVSLVDLECALAQVLGQKQVVLSS